MVPSCCEVRCGGGPRRGSAASHASFCEKNIIKNTCIVKSKKNTYHSKNSYSEAAMIEELNGDFLQWLRGFYYVSQTGSIRRAAQMMNRNPSTISYQIRSLEEELNTVLFDRYKKSLRITPEAVSYTHLGNALSSSFQRGSKNLLPSPMASEQFRYCLLYTS